MKIILRRHNLKPQFINLNSEFIYLSCFEDYCTELLRKATLIIFVTKINGIYKDKILFSKG